MIRVAEQRRFSSVDPRGPNKTVNKNDNYEIKANHLYLGTQQPKYTPRYSQIVDTSYRDYWANLALTLRMWCQAHQSGRRERMLK